MFNHIQLLTKPSSIQIDQPFSGFDLSVSGALNPIHVESAGAYDRMCSMHTARTWVMADMAPDALDASYFRSGAPLHVLGREQDGEQHQQLIEWFKQGCPSSERGAYTHDLRDLARGESAHGGSLHDQLQRSQGKIWWALDENLAMSFDEKALALFGMGIMLHKARVQGDPKLEKRLVKRSQKLAR